jgi:peptidoglycan/LPS O-acetylase OafA/YrhL
LLLHELQKTQTINIPKFYLRRILRIWPIYYLVIVVVIFVLYLFGKQSDILNQDLPYYIFFAANIPFIGVGLCGIPLIVHYWSIGVEEQFYLFFPWLVKFSKKKIILAVVCVFCLWLGLKYGSWVLFTNKSLIYKFFAVTRFHCMMLGGLGAILFFNRNVLFLKIFTNKYAQIFSWLLFLFSGFYMKFCPSAFTSEVFALLSLFLIMSQVQGKPKFINLENNFFDFIGKISYGIYVIHPLIIFLLSKIWLNLHVQIPINGQYIIIYLMTPVFTIIIASLSYTYFEKPFLKLKSRFAIVKSANSRKLAN